MNIEYVRPIPMNVQYGWKIVTPQLLSIIAPGQATVRYAIGEWVYAPDWLANKGYHLTFFPEYQDALSFFSSNTSIPWRETCMYQCMAKGVTYPKPMLSTTSLKIGRINGLSELAGAQWPRCTAMAIGIELLGMVSNRKINQDILKRILK